MPAIARIHAREVLDSRGRPTLEVVVTCRDGTAGSAIVPSGASTGAAEAHELRDGDPQRYDGLGVLRAVANVRHVLGPALQGCDPADQAAIDARLIELDGTAQKSRLGANALLGVSLAAAHAAAAAQGVPLYVHLHRLWSQTRAEAAVAHDGLPMLAEAPMPTAVHAPLPPDAPKRTAANAPLPPNTPLPHNAPLPADAAPRLPVPMVNMISGGLHAGGNLEFQDFLVLPHGAPDYPTALRWIVTIYRRLAALLADAGYEHHLVADEGGFGPRLPDHATACALVVRAVEAAGLRPGVDASLAIDVASTHFFRGGRYHLRDAARSHAAHAPAGSGTAPGPGAVASLNAIAGPNPVAGPNAVAGPNVVGAPNAVAGPGAVAGSGAAPAALSTPEMIDYVERLARQFPIASLEDPLAEEDWDGWSQITQRLGERLLLIGDDLFATNPRRLQYGIARRAANAVLIKPNQIGTLTETLRTMRLAASASLTCVVSARSGESEDTTIADLAVATAAPYIKIGSVTRSERLAKYNRLLRIAEELSAHDAH